MRRLTGFIVVAIALLAEADCSSIPSPNAAIAGCTTEEARLNGAIVAGAAATHPAATPSVEGLGSAATSLAKATDKVTTYLGGVRACRVASLHAAHGDARIVAAEGAADSADIAAARRFHTDATNARGTLESELYSLENSVPGSQIKVAKALAAPPPPPQPYIAVVEASIQAEPSSSSPQIALIRRGLHVAGANAPAPAGWTAVSLNDGSLGYVQSDLLNAAAPNPSAQADRHEAADIGDPLVQLAVAIERTLPQSLGRLAASVDSASIDSGGAGRPAI